MITMLLQKYTPLEFNITISTSQFENFICITQACHNHNLLLRDMAKICSYAKTSLEHSQQYLQSFLYYLLKYQQIRKHFTDLSVMGILNKSAKSLRQQAAELSDAVEELQNVLMTHMQNIIVCQSNEKLKISGLSSFLACLTLSSKLFD